MGFDLASSLKLVISIVLLICASAVSHAQNALSKENREWERQQREQRRADQDFENRVRQLGSLSDLKVAGASRPRSRPPHIRPRLTEEQKKILEPSLTDQAAFADYLRQPNTGIVRLLPREKYDHTITMPLRGGGAYYSFSKLSHESSPLSDIRFQDGKLQTGFNNLTLGLITILGDVPLEDLSLSTAAVEFLRSFAVPGKYSEFKNQVEQNRVGFETGGNIYKSTLPVRLNSTYVLRSTIYQESDIVVALRVVSSDPDGSITLLWKRLSKQQAKKLKDVPRSISHVAWE